MCHTLLGICFTHTMGDEVHVLGPTYNKVWSPSHFMITGEIKRVIPSYKRIFIQNRLQPSLSFPACAHAQYPYPRSPILVPIITLLIWTKLAESSLSYEHFYQNSTRIQKLSSLLPLLSTNNVFVTEQKNCLFETSDVRRLLVVLSYLHREDQPGHG